MTVTASLSATGPVRSDSSGRTATCRARNRGSTWSSRGWSRHRGARRARRSSGVPRTPGSFGSSAGKRPLELTFSRDIRLERESGFLCQLARVTLSSVGRAVGRPRSGVERDAVRTRDPGRAAGAPARAVEPRRIHRNVPTYLGLIRAKSRARARPQRRPPRLAARRHGRRTRTGTAGACLYDPTTSGWRSLVSRVPAAATKRPTRAAVGRNVQETAASSEKIWTRP
jgi:hypothetical protein